MNHDAQTSHLLCVLVYLIVYILTFLFTAFSFNSKKKCYSNHKFKNVGQTTHPTVPFFLDTMSSFNKAELMKQTVAPALSLL